MRRAVVVPSWNGRRWLPGLLASLRAQTAAPDEIIVVDNGSADGTVAWLAAEAPDVRVIALPTNTGFAVAANVGFQEASAELVALVNSDVELRPDWLERASAPLIADPRVASVATKMVSLRDPGVIDDAGDILRRDGVCEQRGRGRRDEGRWDTAGDVFAACAGAAVYRRSAVLAVGGFEERFFAYLEDVDLGLRLRLAGHVCRYEPAVALHAGGGSSAALARGPAPLVARNTLLMVLRAFPVRWTGPVLYRQASWIIEAARGRTLHAHLRGLAGAVPLAPAFLRERREMRRGAVVGIATVVAPRPWHGPAAGGHPESPE